MRIGFIGAGKVGFSLGKYFVTNDIKVSGYYNRNPQAAKEAAEFTDTEYYESISSLIRDSEVIFITVSDGAIADVCKQIRALQISNKIFCHCSGALSSDVFSGITGCCGYSVHPFFAVSNRLESYKELSAALFTIEGPDIYRDKIADILRKCGNRVIFIDADKKIKYHGAAVFASNLMTGLMETAIEELTECGFDRNSAKDALMSLAGNNMEHLREMSIEDALTGPVERCDVETVRKHILNIAGDDREIYILLSRKVLEIARRKNPDRNYNEMEDLLNG